MELLRLTSRPCHVLAPPWFLRELEDLGAKHSTGSAPRPISMELLLPVVARRQKPAVTLVLGYGVPTVGLGATRIVGVVHDTVPWERPETMGRLGRTYLGPMTRKSVRASRFDRILVPAETVARELETVAPQYKERIDVIGEAASSFWRPPEVRRSASDGLRIITVGAQDPRKDVGVVVEAVRIARSRGVPVELRMVGRPGWIDIDPGDAIALGSLSDDDLRREYQSADVLISASRAEGFNLPVAEAAACGTPAILSDTPLHRELFEEALAFFPVGDSLTLAMELERAWKTRDAEAWGHLATATAARFRWEDCARSILTAIEGVLA